MTGMHLAELNLGCLLAPAFHERTHGDCELAFGWNYVNNAQVWKTHAYAQTAAE